MIKLSAAAQARLAAAKDWPADPDYDEDPDYPEDLRACEQHDWAMKKMSQKGLDQGPATFAIDPLHGCSPTAWDQLCDQLLDEFPRGKISSALAKYLVVRVIECVPDMTRLPRAARLLRLLLDADRIGMREIGKPAAFLPAYRYWRHHQRAGVAVGVREVAAHANISHGLAGRWMAHWREQDREREESASQL